MAHQTENLAKLKKGNELYLSAKSNPGDVSPEVRKDTTVNGQHPAAIVVCCSDSRVVPEAIFSAGIGEIFVIRVAGNVMLGTQMASVQYAAGHLGSRTIIVLGHTHCGAVGATLEGGAHGFVKILTDEIKAAIGDEKDEYKACVKNVEAGVNAIKTKLADDHEALTPETDVLGAVYDIETGKVEWL